MDLWKQEVAALQPRVHQDTHKPKITVSESKKYDEIEMCVC